MDDEKHHADGFLHGMVYPPPHPPAATIRTTPIPAIPGSELWPLQYRWSLHRRLFANGVQRLSRSADAKR